MKVEPLCEGKVPHREDLEYKVVKVNRQCKSCGAILGAGLVICDYCGMIWGMEWTPQTQAISDRFKVSLFSNLLNDDRSKRYESD